MDKRDNREHSAYAGRTKVGTVTGPRVLIGGEFTGTIRDAFTARGIYAMSCDFKPSLTPGPHYQGNWWDVMFDGWNLGILHPTCTNMANSGAKHLYQNMHKSNGLNTERWVKLGQDAWAIWDLLERCPIEHIAIENPIMMEYAQIMSGLKKLPKQVVQPWWFGTDPDGPDNVTKATCWWRRGHVPELRRTGTLDGSTARDEVFQMTPTDDPEDRRMARSAFHPGHAAAIAAQWGDFILSKYRSAPVRNVN